MLLFRIRNRRGVPLQRLGIVPEKGPGRAGSPYGFLMSKRFRACSPDQAFLLPPSLQDWLPEAHLAPFIADVANELDVSASQGGSIARLTSVTLTTAWQQVYLTGTLQGGLTALALQIGGGHTIAGGQVYDVWDAVVNPVATAGAVVTNIVPASEQVTGPSWMFHSATVTATSVAAPDGTSTAQTVTASSGSTDSYLFDLVQNTAQYSSQVVTASVYLRVSSGTADLDLFLVNYGANGTTVPAQTTVALNTSWQRFELTGTNQPGLQTLYLQIGGGGTFQSGRSISIWGTQIVVGTSPDGYVETQNTTTVTGTSQTLAANGLNEVYSYDSFGNMEQSGMYTFIQPYNAANQLSGWGYDAAGNLLADAFGKMYQYDAEGKINNVSGTSYVYDTEGRRVEKSGTAVVDTIYFGDGRSAGSRAAHGRI